MACLLPRLPSPPRRIQGSVRQTPGSLFKRCHGIASHACKIAFVLLSISRPCLGLRLCLHFSRGLVGGRVTLFYQTTPFVVVCRAICHGLAAKDTHLHHHDLRLPPGDVPNSDLMTVGMSHVWYVRPLRRKTKNGGHVHMLRRKQRVHASIRLKCNRLVAEILIHCGDVLLESRGLEARI